ncbi:MAG TPA: hypothetical protein DD435_00905 [Cyanobacteria bacterium UBA8530]|nr:hypothetical protein [Cyanobacteria bacterium UBA8530]
MYRFRISISLTSLALCFFLSGCLTPNGASTPKPLRIFSNGEVLIGSQPSTSAQALQDLRRKYRASLIGTLLPGVERWRVSGDPETLSKQLFAEPQLRYAQPNYSRRVHGAPIPEDGDLSTHQWHLMSDSSNFEAAWADPDFAGATKDEPPGSGVVVAVVDSGVDVHHPDLEANIVKDLAGNPIFIDEVGSDLYGDRDFTGKDGCGHGTHVAGLIAAVAYNNPTFQQGPSGNIVGGAPGAKILPVKVVNYEGDAGEGGDFVIAKGIKDAVDWRGVHGEKVKIINLSIGGPNPAPVLADVLAYACEHDVLMVISAGNKGEVAGSDFVEYPAAYAGAVAVGATTPGNRRAAYSCKGLELAIVAPGGGSHRDKIFSTLPTEPCFYSLSEGEPLNFGYLSGTSMAAPLVSAAAALVVAQAKILNQTLTPAQIRTRLVATATDLGNPGFDEDYGYGLLDAARALAWTSHSGRK